MILNETYTLNNGVEIPKIGLGTWFIKNSKVEDVIKDATDIGYRLIDTAYAYNNEKGVGNGIKNCVLDREELFITTKLHADVKTYDGAKKHIDEQLKTLGLDYLDMYLIHAPQPWRKWRDKNERFFEENINVWKAIEEAYKDGKINAIGVSNFLVDDLKNLMGNCEIKPMVNQILNHVGSTPKDIIDFCSENDILVESYAPLGHGNAVKNKHVIGLAEKYGVDPSQICMKYVVEMGTTAIPKATSRSHLKSNTQIDFKMSNEDLKTLQNIEFKGYGLRMKFMPVFSGKKI